MKKVLGLAIAALLLIGLVVGGTLAYFSDTESTTGNTFTAGTIDLSVNGENPWTTAYTTELTDLKPCMTGTLTSTLTNEGTNPMDVWKRITAVSTGAGTETEPEIAHPDSPATDIDGVIRYSMDIDDTPEILETENFTISAGSHHLTGVTTAVKDHWMYLGVLAKGASMKVEQYYHMDKDTTNWAQGDTMTFTIEFFAQQSEGTPQPPVPGTELPGHTR
jgi:predicted ribosomally synthesized peptide with SipW-like signal peptide